MTKRQVPALSISLHFPQQHANAMLFYLCLPFSHRLRLLSDAVVRSVEGVVGTPEFVCEYMVLRLSTRA